MLKLKSVEYALLSFVLDFSVSMIWFWDLSGKWPPLYTPESNEDLLMFNDETGGIFENNDSSSACRWTSTVVLAAMLVLKLWHCGRRQRFHCCIQPYRNSRRETRVVEQSRENETFVSCRGWWKCFSFVQKTYGRLKESFDKSIGEHRRAIPLPRRHHFGTSFQIGRRPKGSPDNRALSSKNKETKCHYMPQKTILSLRR